MAKLKDRCGEKNPLRGCKRSKETAAKIRAKQIKPVAKLDEYGNVLETFPSMQDAAKSLGICPQGISACCRRVKKTAKGFGWAYLEDVKDFNGHLDIGVNSLSSGDY